MTYTDINVEKFQHINDLIEEFGEDASLKIVDYLYGVDSENIPYILLQSYLSEIAFIGKEIPERKLCDHYKLNGHTYDLQFNPSLFTVGQFADLQAYTGGRYVDLLSVVMIPKGHAYNDGYDMEEVKRDLGELPIPDASAIVRFFLRWLRRYAKASLRYSIRLAKKGKMSRSQLKRIEGMALRLISSPLYGSRGIR